MATQNYFGLTSDDGSFWTLVQRHEWKNACVKTFRNTLEGLNDLVEYIRNRFSRPRIAIASSQKHAFSLLKFLCGIPDAEVMFVSDIGYRQYQVRVADNGSGLSRRPSHKAHILAQCAQHMI